MDVKDVFTVKPKNGSELAELKKGNKILQTENVSLTKEGNGSNGNIVILHKGNYKDVF